MIWNRRDSWLKGHRANVDGIAFGMPVGTQGSPALFAVFSIDARAAQLMLPGEELHAARLWSRGLLVIAVVDYLDTSIGTYVEFCIGILCTRGRRPAPRLLPMLAQPLFGTGVYIYDLPVSTEISVKGGLGIWGMPKRQANLDFHADAAGVSSQYDLDGQLVARIDVPRRRTLLPMFMRGAGYGSFRGMLGKSHIRLRGWSGLAIGGKGVRLVIGDHPRAAVLKTLDINPRALFAGYAPRLAGVLEDRIETSFLTAAQPPAAPGSGLADVVGLGLSQDRLAPPSRALSNAMIERLTPGQLAGREARPTMTEGQRGKETV